MNTLIFDTSRNFLTLALIKNNALIDASKKDFTDPSSNLLPSIIKLLEENLLKLKDINLIIIGKGPGSFTGLRISMATAKGLCYGENIPLVAVSNLEVYEENGRINNTAQIKTIITAIDAKKNRFYIRLSKNNKTIIEGLDGNPEDLNEIIKEEKEVFITGPDSSLFQNKMKLCFPKININLDNTNSSYAKEFYKLGLRRFNELGPDSLDDGPVYIRRSDAEEALLKKKEENNA